MAKLNQVIAIEKGVKGRVTQNLTQLHRVSTNAEVYSGLNKTYEPLDEEGETSPPQNKKVQLQSSKVIDTVQIILSELFDVTAQKDFANCDARANVVVDGVVIIERAPVTYLLFLEKQLNDLRTFVKKMPQLSADEDWHYNQSLGIHSTMPVKTKSTKKLQKPIVLHPPTVEHPAQTQLVTEDVTVGYWSTVKQSGAITNELAERILGRINKLNEAVKFAREEANSIEAPKVGVGDAVFSYLFE